jgi:hypothetical protein
MPTKDEILNMPANEKSNMLIAERFFGWMWWNNAQNPHNFLLSPDQNWPPEFDWVPGKDPAKDDFSSCDNFTEDIAAAWLVMEWMRENTVEKYTAPSLFSVPHGWSMVLYEKNDNHAPAWLDAFAPTAPLAICRAALLAVMDCE